MEMIHQVLHYIIPFLIVISVIVFVHEFGHYWVARRCGVKVEAFSIGFGPEMFGWNDSHGTRWKVSILPLGGYVKMFGDAGPASDPSDDVKNMTAAEKSVSFFYQPVWKRIAIVAAGPAFNYIFAILVMTLLFMEPPFGMKVPPLLCHVPESAAGDKTAEKPTEDCFFFQGQHYTEPVISAVTADSAAAAAGMQPGDRVLSVDGVTIDRFEDMRTMVMLNTGAPMKLEIERKGEPMTLDITPKIKVMDDRFGGKHMMGQIGVSSTKVAYKRWPFFQAVGQATLEAYNLSITTLRSLGQMILGLRGTEELGGPLRIAALSGHVAEDGPAALVVFMAMISVNLGLVNLLPVPMLDGGHLLYYIAEQVRGRPLHEKIQQIGLRIGMAMLLCLMVFATLNDLVQLKVFSFIKNMFS